MAHDFDEDGEGWGEQSRFAAHLDRGWTQLERGDVATARAAAQHALEARPDAPEALLLMGAAAAAQDQLAEAEDLFQRATEIDPEYPEPYIELAHMLVFRAERPRDAIDVIDAALDLDTLTPIERVDLGVLALEAAVVAGDVRGATARLHALDGLADLRDLLDARAGRSSDEDDDEERDALLRLHGFGDPDELDDGSEDVEPPDDEELAETFHRAIGTVLRLARVLVDVGDGSSAADWLRATVARAPDEAEAWYLLGDVELLLGHPKAAALAAVQTLRLDLRAALPAWVPSPATIQRRTLDLLSAFDHPQVRAEGGRGGTDVLVIVQECPSPELLVEGVDPRVPLMSLSARTAQGDTTALTGIAVYRRNLAQQSADLDAFWDNLSAELEDELAAVLPAPENRGDAPTSRAGQTKPPRASKSARSRASGDADPGSSSGEASETSRPRPSTSADGAEVDPKSSTHQTRSDAGEAKPTRRRKTPRLQS